MPLARYLSLLLLVGPLGNPAWGKARVIAVLEYRAGVRQAPGIAAGMAGELGRLTSHRVVGPAEARLRAGAGSQWDPQLIASFLQVMPEAIAIRHGHTPRARVDRLRRKI